MKNYKKQNKEVFYFSDSIVAITKKEITKLTKVAETNERKRIRLCAHPNVHDLLHEMLIVHEKNTYIPPHKHPGKSESFHIIEGIADVVVFEDDGKISKIIHMGDYTSGLNFYYRLSEPKFHTLLVLSDQIVFHEVANGPFESEATIFADWAPKDNNLPGVGKYMTNLKARVANES